MTTRSEKNFNRDVHVTELLIQLVRMTTSVAYTKLKKIISINANKTKYNLVAHSEIETCTV